MRKLTLIGICLLIVTLAIGADARGGRDDSSEKSRESSSASDRHSAGPADRPSSNGPADRPGPSYHPGGQPTTRSDSGPSASVGNSSHGYNPGYRASTEPAQERRIELPGRNQSGPGYPVYRSDNPGSNMTIEKERSTGPADSGYRPGGEARIENPATPPSAAAEKHDIYQAYRPGNGERSVQPVVPGRDRGYGGTFGVRTGSDDNGSARNDDRTDRGNSNERSIGPVPAKDHQYKGGTIYRSYDLPKSDDTPKPADRPRADSNANRDPAYSGYRPSHDSSPGPDARRDDRSRGDDHNTYRPSGGNKAPVEQYPTTRSIRDRKLAEARMEAARAYQPAVSKPHYTYSTYRPPKDYRPAVYREGHYYYSHPHYTRPCSFGYWSFDYYSGFCRRSIYFHYGFFPYIEVRRIIVDTYPTIVYVNQPIYTIYGVSYESSRYPGLDEALGDIRSAWVSGRYDLIERHVSDDDIAVLIDGKYDYSVTADDYLAMTKDALGEMNTISFVWDKVRQRKDGTVTGFATHTYLSGDSSRKVYVSYTMKRIDGRYYITEVGSTQAPWN